MHHFITQGYYQLSSGSPIATSLVYDNQSRTLNCTCTSGPAINVTWRKDGVVITPNDTYQQTMRRVHYWWGIYQTVLTIDAALDQSDIEGLYVCTVENGLGTSSVELVLAGNGELISHMHHFITQGYYTCINCHCQLIETRLHCHNI